MDKLKSQLESLLFISAKPMAVKQLAELLEVEAKQVIEAGESLAEEYKKQDRGVQVIKNGAKYQMVSTPANTKLIQAFIKDETKSELSRPSLEALTIIAYRGPIKKTDLDKIRGINCSLILRNLMLRGLVETIEQNKETYYNATMDFIRFLGINDLAELPDYQRLHNDETVDKIVQNP
ncbi:MAG: SMC-Scp complex subunit ScpB [bacterium]